MAPHHPQSSFPCFTGQQWARFLLTPKFLRSLLYTESFPSHSHSSHHGNGNKSQVIWLLPLPLLWAERTLRHSPLLIPPATPLSLWFYNPCQAHVLFLVFILPLSRTLSSHDCMIMLIFLRFLLKCHFTKKTFLTSGQYRPFPLLRTISLH